MLKKIFLFFSLTTLFVFSSCTGTDDEKVFSEGIIEYDAKVVDLSNPMANMAPTKMTCKFKDDLSMVEMSAGLGLFSTSFISNPKEQTLTQMVKLLNKKFALVQNIDAIKEANEDYPLEITPTNETKIIAGYTCKKAHVKINNETQDEFDVFYTNDIKINTPNFATPYNTLDGVLLEYQMKKFGLEMRFTAKSVKKAEIEDEIFKLSKEYKIISKEEMDEIFLGII